MAGLVCGVAPRQTEVRSSHLYFNINDSSSLLQRQQHEDAVSSHIPSPSTQATYPAAQSLAPPPTVASHPALFPDQSVVVQVDNKNTFQH